MARYITEEYFREFEDDVIARMGIDNDSIRNSFLMSVLIKNLSTIEDIYDRPDEKNKTKSIVIKSSLDEVPDVEDYKESTGLKDTSTYINEEDYKEQQKELKKERDKHREIITNLRDYNIFKNNLHKIMDSLNRDKSFKKNGPILVKFIDRKLNKFKNSFIKIREKTKEEEININKKYEKRINFLEEKLQKIVNSTNKRTLATKDKYELELNKVLVKKEIELRKNNNKFENFKEEKISELKIDVDTGFSNTYGVKLFNANNTLGLNLIKKNIKPKDRHFVAEAISKNVHLTDPIKIMKDKIKVFETPMGKGIIMGFTKKQLNLEFEKSKFNSIPKLLLQEIENSLYKSFTSKVPRAYLKDLIAEEPEIRAKIREKMGFSIVEFSNSKKSLIQTMKNKQELKEQKQELKQVIEVKNKLEVKIEKLQEDRTEQLLKVNDYIDQSAIITFNNSSLQTKKDDLIKIICKAREDKSIDDISLKQIEYLLNRKINIIDKDLGINKPRQVIEQVKTPIVQEQKVVTKQNPEIRQEKALNEINKLKETIKSSKDFENNLKSINNLKNKINSFKDKSFSNKDQLIYELKVLDSFVNREINKQKKSEENLKKVDETIDNLSNDFINEINNPKEIDKDKNKDAKGNEQEVDGKDEINR